MDLYFQSVLICAVTSLMLAIQCLISRTLHARPAVVSFVFLILHVFLWCIFEIIYRYHFSQFGIPQRLYILELILLPASSWLFFKKYLGFQFRSRFIQRLLFAGWIALLTWVLIGASEMELTTLERPLPLANLAFILMLGTAMHLKGRATLNWQYRRHISTLGWGAYLVASAFALNEVGNYFRTFPSLGHLSLAIYIYVCFFALKNNQLLNTERVLSQVVHITTMTLTMTLVYRVVVFWTGEDPELLFFNTIIASFVLFLIFEPLKSFSRVLINTFYARGTRPMIQKLREASERLISMSQLDDVIYLSLATLRDCLLIQECSFHVLDPMKSTFTNHAPDFASAVFPLEISRTNLLELPSIVDAPVIDTRRLTAQLQVTDHRDERLVLKKWLDFIQENHAHAMIPLAISGQVVALVLMRSHQPLRTSGALKKELETFLREVARTIHHLRIFRQSTQQERLMDLGLMAAGLAHEFKNPIGAIHGAAEILASKQAQDDPTRSFATMILDETNRLNKLVHQILQFSQGDKPLEKMIDMDLGRVIEKTYERIFQNIPARLISSLKNTPVVIKGQPELLDLVFTNLLQNIKDAVTKNKLPQEVIVKIDHRTFQDADGINWTQIDLIDQGGGMSQDLLDRIFLPYVTTKPQGTGLGMSLVKKALEFHGANIQVSSTLGKGTKFSLFFKESVKLLAKGRSDVIPLRHAPRPHY